MSVKRSWEPRTRRETMSRCSAVALAIDWLATARREVRDWSRLSPYPSIRRPQWPCGDHHQPHCPCELLWRCAMKSTYLGRSCRSLPAARRRRDAPLPRHSRIEVLDNGRSFLPQVCTSASMHRSHARVRVCKVCTYRAEERRGRVRERLVPSRKAAKTGPVHNNARTL